MIYQNLNYIQLYVIIVSSAYSNLSIVDSNKKCLQHVSTQYINCYTILRVHVKSNGGATTTTAENHDNHHHQSTE